MTKRDGKTPSQRQLRVGEEVRHAIAWILERGELRDPAFAGNPLTITEVRISPDLKNATCFITPLGGGDESEVTHVLDALKRASGYLRHEVSERMNLRFSPRLSFEFDHSFDEAGRIESILHSPDVQRDLATEDAPEDAAEHGHENGDT